MIFSIFRWIYLSFILLKRFLSFIQKLRDIEDFDKTDNKNSSSDNNTVKKTKDIEDEKTNKKVRTRLFKN